MNLFWLKKKGQIKGIFQDPIPFKPLIASGDSSIYFGNDYESQQYGNYDTETCTKFAFTDVMETRLTMLEAMNLIPQDTLTWAKANGYKDSVGDWYLSRRWEGILCGKQNTGDSLNTAYILAGQVGLIPNSVLPYNLSQATQDSTLTQFVSDYFNTSVITPSMRALGQEFLKRFTILGESVDPTLVNIMTYLHEGSLQIAVPAVAPYWNQVNVPTPGNYTVGNHSVELYKADFTQDFSDYVFDSYTPKLKQLAKQYPIVAMVRLYIWPKPVAIPVPLPQFNFWMSFWFNVYNWIIGKPQMFPSVPIGGV
jgi:hypothetical protein